MEVHQGVAAGRDVVVLRGGRRLSEMPLVIKWRWGVFVCLRASRSRTLDWTPNPRRVRAAAAAENTSNRLSERFPLENQVVVGMAVYVPRRLVAAAAPRR